MIRTRRKKMKFEKIFTLSYDDGVQQDKRLIEIFDNYYLKCTFNINAGLLGHEHTSSHFGKQIRHNRIPEDEIAQVYKNHEIASHGFTHPDLTKLGREEIMHQIINDRKALSSLVGYNVVGHAYPGGKYDLRVANCLRDDCGITYARTIDSHLTFACPENLLMWHPTCAHNHINVFDLLDKFIDLEPEESNMLFYLWGHSFEFDYDEENNNWDHIERICEKIAGRPDIHYCTNSDVVHFIVNQTKF
jgi:peptidoglycan-N-acetylglucosamine deacetylase